MRAPGLRRPRNCDESEGESKGLHGFRPVITTTTYDAGPTARHTLPFHRLNVKVRDEKGGVEKQLGPNDRGNVADNNKYYRPPYSRTPNRISPMKAFTFVSPWGLDSPLTCAHSRLLGPCFKTGRVRSRISTSRRVLGTGLAGVAFFFFRGNWLCVWKRKRGRLPESQARSIT
jgi:hypothetical protein